MRKHSAQKRLFPRFWERDWYSMACLRRSIEQTIKQYNLLSVGQHIVDIGCGDCPYKPIFLAHGCKYIGCDIEGEADIKMEIEKPIPLPDNSFDGVVSFQVLEQVWDLDWYLGECYRLLKPGGWLLLSTHGNWLYHPHPTDYRRWTKDGLSLEISSRGFRLETVNSVVGPLAWTTQFRLLGYYVALQKLGILGSIILVPLACIMNLRMIVEDWITPAAIRDTNASVYVTLSRK